MHSIQILVVIIAITSQAFSSRSHPRQHDDVDVDSDLTNFQKAWKQRMNSEGSSYVKNQVVRLPTKLTEQSPMAANVLGMSKDNLKQLPMDSAMRALSEVCHAAISTETLNPTYTPELSEINVQLLTESRNVTVPLENVENLWSATGKTQEEFDSEKETVMYINSWRSNSADPDDSLNVLRAAYRCRGTENFIVVDIGSFIDNYHDLQVLNTERIGQWVGEALLRMKENMPMSKLHLIGHGVGAHVAAAAARTYTDKTGDLLPRITGLDPAMLCYKNYENVVELHRGDAKFVDIIHSNSYGLGNPAPMGDVDFYPNNRRTNIPGSDNVMSAHEMAVRYFAETVLPENEKNFIGMRNNNENINQRYQHQRYSSIAKNQDNSDQVPMGYSTPDNVKGVYYLETNPQFPHGKNAKSYNVPRCMNMRA